MQQLLDTDIHQEPMAAAVILYWLAESHAKAHDLGEGILIPWAMLGLGLVATESTFNELPLKKQNVSGWFRSEGARSWRGYSKQTILAWKDTFWTALAHGEVAGILTLKEGRLLAQGKVNAPKAVSPSGLVRRAVNCFVVSLVG
jgi:hypothetical protein